MGIKIALIGAGSAVFSLNLMRDMCLSKYLDESTVLCMMDIDETRLATTYKFCTRFAKEVGAKFKITKTLNRKTALKGADFVINTAMPGGAEYTLDGWKVAKKNGYDFGGSLHIMHDESFWINFHQLKLTEEIYLDMQDICPNAWMILVANPVMTMTTYFNRKYPGCKLIGMCHGSNNAKNIAKTIGLDTSKISYECPGVNHFLWLNEFKYQGQDAFPLLDKWLDEKWEQYLVEHPDPCDKMGLKAVDMYRRYGVFPIGDTASPGGGAWGHFYHTSREVEKQWNEDPNGWYDNHFIKGNERVQKMYADAFDMSKKITDTYKVVRSSEPMIPVVEALAFDIEKKIVVNIQNKEGFVEGVPTDFNCEVPAIVSARGVQGLHTKPLPKPVQAWLIRDRVAPANMEIEAFVNHSKDYLIDLICMDPWTKTRAQAESLLKDILDMPFNADMKAYYNK